MWNLKVLTDNEMIWIGYENIVNVENRKMNVKDVLWIMTLLL